MSSEESNKMSKETPLQDSPSDPEWKLEDLQKAIIDSAEMYDELLDKAGQHELPEQTAEAMWEMERHMWSQRQRTDGVDESSY